MQVPADLLESEAWERVQKYVDLALEEGSEYWMLVEDDRLLGIGGACFDRMAEKWQGWLWVSNDLKARPLLLCRTVRKGLTNFMRWLKSGEKIQVTVNGHDRAHKRFALHLGFKMFAWTLTLENQARHWIHYEIEV